MIYCGLLKVVLIQFNGPLGSPLPLQAYYDVLTCNMLTSRCVKMINGDEEGGMFTRPGPDITRGVQC